MIVFIQILSGLLALFSALTSSLLFLKNSQPGGDFKWFLKVLAGAISPISALAGIVGIVLGLYSAAYFFVLMGFYGACVAIYDIVMVTSQHTGFANAFGIDWEKKISAERHNHLLARRWTWKLPSSPIPRRQNNIPFWTIPGTNRELLCDIWQPSECVTPTGLALIYFHGSGWAYSDKGIGTDTFFSHISGQGHVVMDVAYRLFPETGMEGMICDVKRAIAWMKIHADEYQVNPERIVLCGGSAGGHLSMLAAYAPDKIEFTSDDLCGYDLSVRAVISEYGISDLVDCYYKTNQHKTSIADESKTEESTNKPFVLLSILKFFIGDNYKKLELNKGSDTGSFNKILGGHPNEVPDKYRMFSPIHYIHPDCPPTLLIQGKDDLITSIDTTVALYKKLVSAGVPAINVIFPLSEHGFDLALPEISPVAQSAFYDIDRFLAVLS